VQWIKCRVLFGNSFLFVNAWGIRPGYTWVQVCQYCTGVTRLILDGNMQRIFFGQLSLMETQKVVERLINYVLFKVSNEHLLSVILEWQFNTLSESIVTILSVCQGFSLRIVLVSTHGLIIFLCLAFKNGVQLCNWWIYHCLDLVVGLMAGTISDVGRAAGADADCSLACLVCYFGLY